MKRLYSGNIYRNHSWYTIREFALGMSELFRALQGSRSFEIFSRPIGESIRSVRCLEELWIIGAWIHRRKGLKINELRVCFMTIRSLSVFIVASLERIRWYWSVPRVWILRENRISWFRSTRISIVQLLPALKGVCWESRGASTRMWSSKES